MRVNEAEETLRPIRAGEAGSLAAAAPEGHQAVTLGGASRTLVEAVNDGAVTVDAAGIILYANGRLAEMLESPLETIVGAALPVFVEPADARAFEALLQAALQGRPGRGEVGLLAHGSRRVPVLISASPLRFEEASGAGIVVADLTGQRRTEAALRQAQEELKTRGHAQTDKLSQTLLELQAEIARRRQAEINLEHRLQELQIAEEELRTQNDSLAAAQAQSHRSSERYQALFDLAPDGHLVTDHHGDIIEANQAAAFLLGVPPDQLVGTSFFQYVAEGADHQFPSTFSQLLFERETPPFEAPVKRVAHNPFPAEIIAVTIQDKDQAVTGIRWVLRDITDRKQAELALRQTRDDRDELEATFTSMTEAVLVYDLSGNVVRANPAAAQIMGFDPLRVNLVSLPGRLSSRYPDGRPVGVNDTPSARALRGEAVVGEKYVLTGAGGRDRTIVSSATPLVTAGKVSGAVAVWHDVTAEEQAKARLEESRRLLDALMENVPEGITLADAPDMRIRMVSRYGQEVLGGPQAGLTTEQVAAQRQVFQPDGVTLMDPADLPLARAVLKGETVRDQELVQANAYGQRLPLLCNAAPIRDRHGTIVGGIVTWRDITEQKRLEDLLASAFAEAHHRAAETEAIFGSLSDAVLIYNPDRNVVKVTPSFLATYGFDPVGLNVREVMQRVNCRCLDGSLLKIDDQPTPRAVQVENVRGARYLLRPPGAGADRMVETASTPLRIGGEIVGAVTVWHDITEHERLLSQVQLTADELRVANEELQQHAEELQTLNDELLAQRAELQRIGQVWRESEALFRGLAEAMAQLVWIADSTGRSTYVNRRWEEYTGRGLEAMAVLLEPIHPEDRAFVQAAWQAGKNAGEEDFQSEFRMRRYDGVYRWFLCRAILVYDTPGVPARWIGTATDIHDLKLAQMALAQSEERYRTLFNGMTEGFALHDIICDETGAPSDYRFLAVNPAFERLTDLSRDEVVGKLKSQVPGLRGDDPKWTEIYGQVALTGNSVHFENYSPAVQRWYEVYSYRPAPGQFAVIFTDITQRKQAEQERERLMDQLAAEKARWQATVENMLDPVTVCDAEGRAIYMNAAYSRLVERQIDPTLAVAEHSDFYQLYRPDGTLFPAEDLPLQRAALADESVAGVEIVQRTPGGAERAVIWNAAPLHDASGGVLGAVAVGRDVTVQREVERALQAQTDTLLEQAHMLDLAHVLVRNMDDAIIFWNRGAEELYGWAKAEAVGQNSNALFQTAFPESRAAVERALRETGHWEGELCHTRRDGTRVVVASHQVVHRDNTGRPVAVIEVNNDVTALKRAEDGLRQARDGLGVRVQQRTAELQDANAVLEEEIEERRRAEEVVRQQAQRLAAVAETSHVLVEAGFNVQAMLDEAARVITVCIGEVCVIRLVSADAQRLEVAAYHHADPERRETQRAHLSGHALGVVEGLSGRVFQTREPVFLPAPSAEELRRLVLPASQPYLDRERIGSVIMVPLMTQADVLGILAMYRSTSAPSYTAEDLRLLQSIADRLALAVTNARLHRDLENSLAQEKAIREQLIQAEKLGALGRMIGAVAHELNNPLQTIRNCLYLTDQELAPDSRIHTYIEMARSETQRLVSLVAQLRELYRNRPPGAPQVRRLDELLREVQSLVAPQLESANVQWQEPAELPGLLVPVIQDRLKQVFINLATNAIEAMRPGGGVLQVDVVPSADGQQVAVSFKDTGAGILPENLSRIFEPFFTTKVQGLGLGLAICHEIVQQHGGHITVDSLPDQGAVFTVWLPLVAGQSGRG